MSHSAVVAHDRRAAQALEDADLDFLRAQRDEPVEAGGEALQRFAGQADDQVGVDVDAGLRRAGSAGCLSSLVVVLPAADAFGDVVVEGLDADLELQRAGRELARSFRAALPAGGRGSSRSAGTARAA